MKRLFVAVWPPEEVLDRIAALPRPDRAGLRWTERRQWHVTLRFLGPVPDVGPVAEALGTGLRPAQTTAVLGPAVDRFGRHVLHVPVRGLERVATDVVAATAHLGKVPDERPFSGHLTLARVARQARADLRDLTGAPISAEWNVTSVCLVESHLSANGARYETLEEFPLANR